MYNDVIMTLDFIGFISIFAVLVMVTLTKKRSILKSPVFLLLMAFISIYQGLLFVEWTNITHSLEFLENYVGSLLPLWWLFSFHVLTQSALIRDLTMSESHLRLAMKEISDSEERFKSIYENAPYSISISRYEDGRYVDANSVFYERRGLTKEELLTYKVKDLLGYSEEEGQSLRKQVYETGGLRNKEISVRGKNDEMIYLLYSAVPIQYAGEQCILSIMTDISDKKMAELALRASEEKYRTIFEHSPHWHFPQHLGREVFGGQSHAGQDAGLREQGGASRQRGRPCPGHLSQPREKAELAGCLAGRSRGCIP